MKVLLDTSAYSALRRGDSTVLEIIQQSETVALSAVVIGELYSGFRAGTRSEDNSNLLARFLAKPSARTLPVTEDTALRYAEVLNYLRTKGRPIPTNDMWIAASALEHGLQLVTLDRHFAEIPMLLIQPPESR